MIKIYVTLLEAENLIFNKILEVEYNRLEIKKAQKRYSIAILVYDLRLVRVQNSLLVMFSAVEHFEIPQDDLSLFINHYKVPGGLIKDAKRKVRDLPENNNILNLSGIDTFYSFNFEHYTHIRRALLHIFYKLLQLKDKAQFCHSVLSVMNSLVSLDGFARALILNVVDAKCFPTLDIVTDGFKPNVFFKWAWWGKFTREYYIDKVDMSVEDAHAAKTWLREFDPRSFCVEKRFLAVSSG